MKNAEKTTPRGHESHLAGREVPEMPTAEAATPEAIAALTSELATLRDELAAAKKDRETAETAKLTTEANAQVAAWVRDGRITVTPESPKGGQVAMGGGVTLADFSMAATDSAASKRISAAVRERRKSDPKFSSARLEAELRGSAS